MFHQVHYNYFENFILSLFKNRILLINIAQILPHSVCAAKTSSVYRDHLYLIPGVKTLYMNHML